MALTDTTIRQPGAGWSPDPRHDQAKTSAAGAPCDASAARLHLRHWRVAGALFLLSAGCLLALFSATAGFMVTTWWGDRTYGHGFLILPVAMVLVWRQREQLLALSPRCEPWALVLLGGAVLGWLVAESADVQVVQQFALIAMIQSLFLVMFGWEVTRRVIFPLGFLFFAVPFGNFLVSPLQHITADLSVWLLQWSAVPVFRDHLYIYIPAGSFVVAEACAGIRFLISTIVLGALLAHVLFSSWWRRLTVIALAVVIPVVANGFRAYGIIMIAHLSDFRIAVGVDHIVYGWLFFSIVTLLLIAAAFALRERSRTMPLASFHAEAPGLGTTPPTARRFGLVTLAALMILTAGPVLDRLTDPGPSAVLTAEFPAWRVAGSWQPEPGRVSDWQPVFSGADATVLEAFSDEDRMVELFVAGYAFQRQGSEVVNEMNRFSDETRWRRVGVGRATATVDGQELEVRTERIASTERKRLIWYWYWVDERFTSNKVEAKLLQAKARLLFENPAAAVIAVTADYDDSPAEAAAVLQAFLDDVTSIRTSLEAFARGTTSQSARATPSAERS
ncbi:MAG: exosortase A [Rhodospirillales bacterium]|nr:MAG: exosortase A [Rhodospirillales bacterium]